MTWEYATYGTFSYQLFLPIPPILSAKECLLVGPRRRAVFTQVSVLWNIISSERRLAPTLLALPRPGAPDNVWWSPSLDFICGYFILWCLASTCFYFYISYVSALSFIVNHPDSCMWDGHLFKSNQYLTEKWCWMASLTSYLQSHGVST